MENEKPKIETQNKSPQETLSLVERAETAAKAIKEQNDRAEELVKRNEEAAIRLKLGGGTNSGQIAPEPDPKEKVIDFFKGTDIERALRNYGK